MASTLDAELHAGVDLGPAPGLVGRGDRKAQQSVDHADRMGAGAQDRGGFGDRGAKLAQDLELPRGDSLLGGEHDRFLFLQLGCQVALGARQSLLSHVVTWKRYRIGVADLDVVTEDLVEADLQRADSRPASLRRFETADPLASASRGLGDAVELRVEPRPDRAAIATHRRRTFNQAPSQPLGQPGGPAHLPPQPPPDEPLPIAP